MHFHLRKSPVKVLADETKISKKKFEKLRKKKFLHRRKTCKNCFFVVFFLKKIN